MKAKPLGILTAVLVFCATGAFAQTTYIVDQGGGGSFLTIQACINAVIPGDTCQVDPATYVENIDYLGKDITVVSSSGPGVTIIDGSASGSVVTFTNGETGAAVLSGFTVQNGLATRGGGILCEDATPTIEDCVVTGNNATDAGGGICYWSDNATMLVTLQDSVISRNSAARGGGIAGIGSTILAHVLFATVTNCQMLENTSSGTGGGIHIEPRAYPTNAAAEVRDSVLSRNSAVGSGGGAEFGYSFEIIDSEVTGNSGSFGGGINGYNGFVTRCTIKQNNASTYGGGVSASGLIMADSIVHSNTTDQFGAGIAIASQSEVGTKIANSIIHSNTSSQFGGGIAFSADGTMINCTLSENSAGVSGGGIAISGPWFPAITNSILWADTATSSPEIYEVAGGSASVNDSDVQGGWVGTGNINTDPLFVNPATDDFHLQNGSPAIDVGNNSVIGLPSNDIDGDPRIIPTGGVVDMGADEVPASCGCWVLPSHPLDSTRSRIHVLMNGLPYLLPLSLVFYLRRKKVR